ncbi:hypothetical protein HK405_006822 [Cladochytrium tenue]|nr:hypothetical protein HK405_006822 [Cladochytrium tenue]
MARTLRSHSPPPPISVASVALGGTSKRLAPSPKRDDPLLLPSPPPSDSAVSIDPLPVTPATSAATTRAVGVPPPSLTQSLCASDVTARYSRTAEAAMTPPRPHPLSSFHPPLPSPAASESAQRVRPAPSLQLQPLPPPPPPEIPLRRQAILRCWDDGRFQRALAARLAAAASKVSSGGLVVPTPAAIATDHTPSGENAGALAGSSAEPVDTAPTTTTGTAITSAAAAAAATAAPIPSADVRRAFLVALHDGAHPWLLTPPPTPPQQTPAAPDASWRASLLPQSPSPLASTESPSTRASSPPPSPPAPASDSAPPAGPAAASRADAVRTLMRARLRRLGDDSG